MVRVASESGREHGNGRSAWSEEQYLCITGIRWSLPGSREDPSASIDREVIGVGDLDNSRLPTTPPFCLIRNTVVSPWLIPISLPLSTGLQQVFLRSSVRLDICAILLVAPRPFIRQL